MKKKFLVSLLALVMICALAACGGAVDGSSPATEPTTPAEPEATALEDSTILDAYDAGMECFCWMKLGDLLYDYSNSYEDDNYTYYKVKEYETLDDLRAYFSTLFAEDIVEDLLNSDTALIEVDGKLYGLDGARGANITYGTAKSSVEQVSDTEYMVKVTVDVLADDLETVTGTEEFDYSYEQQADGNWVFTSFPFYL